MQVKSRVVVLVAIVVGVLSAAAPGHQANPKDIGTKRGTFRAGQVQIDHEFASKFYVVDNNIFICTPIEGPRTEGLVLAAMGSDDETWSIAKVPLSDGTNIVQYPVFADLRTPSGERRSLLPASLKLKVGIKPDEILHSDGQLGFEIKTNRSIKAGESISVLFINGKNNTPSILSVQAAGNTGDRPSLTAFLRDEKLAGQRAAIEAWRIEKDHVH